MDFSYFFTAFLLVTGPVVLTRGQDGGMVELAQKLIGEKITDPATKALIMSKLPEIQNCLMGLIKMSPQVAMQVVDQMIPAFNTCGMKLSAASDNQKASVFFFMFQMQYLSCTNDAIAKIKASTGMGAEDAKVFDTGMGCINKAIGF
ncbi:uncharacterized protein LOC144157913 isoform X1 [Haemaphysalis longicornis]